MNIDEIANQAELIFEGTVIESKADPDSAGSISTYITFSVSDLIKGDYDQTTIELKFLGGSLNGRTVAVAGSRLPQTGETGIYFVESIVDDLINPLLGWSQGYFLVQTDDNGEERILTSNYEPVNDIQSARQVPAAIRKPLTIVSEDTSNASGVVIDEDLTNTQQALSVDEFKTRIRNLIEN